MVVAVCHHQINSIHLFGDGIRCMDLLRWLLVSFDVRSDLFRERGPLTDFYLSPASSQSSFYLRPKALRSSRSTRSLASTLLILSTRRSMTIATTAWTRKSKTCTARPCRNKGILGNFDLDGRVSVVLNHINHYQRHSCEGCILVERVSSL